MYELIQAGERTYYLECPAKIGLYRLNDQDVCLIDSGNDKDAGRKVLKILDEKGWHLQCILNTHSNADHIGGNHFLQQRTGCKIFAQGLERAFTEYPYLEPSFLYGGYPCPDLRHKFLLAKASETLPLEDSGFPPAIQTINLPGHFFHMVGFRTPDNVVFLADCLTDAQVLAKYHIFFIYDVAAFLDTLTLVENLKAELFVPSHAPATQDITKLVAANRAKVGEIAATILNITTTPLSFEDILKGIFDHYALNLNFEQYVLVGSTIRSYLAWLKDQGRVKVEFADNRLFWQGVTE